MKEVAAFLISSSDDFVALLLADTLLHLLLPRRPVSGVWACFLENALIAVAATGIERTLPSLGWFTIAMLILAMKALCSVMSTNAQNNLARGNHAPNWRQLARLLTMIMLRCFAAFIALWLLKATSPYAGFFVFPFVVLTAIDMALWLTCRLGWQGSVWAVPVENALIIMVLLGAVAASAGQGPTRETMIAFAFIVKIVVTPLLLRLQSQIRRDAADPPTHISWFSIALRGLGSAFGTWIVLG